MSDAVARLKKALADKYEIEDEIGVGGMATVYLARDLKHDRQVAVKVLKPELAAALGTERFPREIKIVARLQHPHILPLYDSGEADGFLYYVMPFVKGESLAERLDRDGELPIPVAVRILREVVDALAHAHANGVLHRDIKPDNVMLSGRHAQVMDFGVAKAVSDAGRQQLTTVGVAVGTPQYMSPEQATGAEHVDARSDIYTVGVMAYEMLTGEPPFRGKSSQQILTAHITQAPPDIVERRSSVPRALAELVMRCLEKKPADRWQSAEEMLSYLEQMGSTSGGVTPLGTPPVQIPRAGAHGSRRLWIGSAAAVVALVIAGGFAWMNLGGSGPTTIEQIAVLPILDLSGEDELFVDAMHDALISSLAQMNTVGVVSRSAVLQLGSGMKTEDVAKQLGVQALVEGSVFRAGERMRITVQLVEPSTLRHLWTNTYDRDVTDVLAAQAEIVAAVAEELGAELAKLGGS